MPKKRKQKKEGTPWSISLLKVVAVLIAAVVVSFLLFQGGKNFALESDYFVIRTVECDDTLAFIQRSDYSRLKGENIFKVDIASLEQHLSRKYPQASEMRVVKQFPDKIRIAAKQRRPFAQTKFNDRVLTLDENTIVLSTTSKIDDKLPFIEGVTDVSDITLGLPLKDKKAKIALKVIQAFYKHVQSTTYKMTSINVDNLSKIYFYTKDQLQIIVDDDKLDRRMKILNIVLNEGQVDLGDVKYVDLRFKEPILGKK